MQSVATSGTAPEFAAPDTEGRIVRLSDFRGTRNVVVVFNRGLF